MVSFPEERSDLSRKPCNALLDEISARIPSQQFETWFRNLPIHFARPDKIIITTPNRFSKNWIDKKFREVILTSARKVFGSTPTIEIVVHSESEGSLAESTPRGGAGLDAEPETGLRSGRRGTPRWPSTTEGEAPLPQETDDILVSTPINRDFTFSNFVVGPSNRLAHAAAIGITEGPGRGYNPVFIYGGVGLGKTHLLHAIIHRLNESPGLRIVCLTSEAFRNQFIAAVDRGSEGDFRRRLRSADILIVDDIQFISNKSQKDRIQEEFFHTFNTLVSDAKQVVLSSDCPPKEISGLQERLISRFKMGLVTRIEAPGFETRVAIIHRKARARGWDIPEPVAEYISNHIVTNIRELEGAILRLFNRTTVQGGPEDPSSLVTLDLARMALQEIVQEENIHSGVTIVEIQKEVAQFYDVKLAELLSLHRNRTVSFARQASMYLSRQLTHCSLQEIGTLTGARDHATVLYSVRKIDRLSKSDPRIEADLKLITNRVMASRTAL